MKVGVVILCFSPAHMSVKESVFPSIKFIGVGTLLGPEMKSTGEVMGIGASFGTAFAKAQIAAGTFLSAKGRAFQTSWQKIQYRSSYEYTQTNTLLVDNLSNSSTHR